MKTDEGVVLPALPEGYEWNTEDGDYNICKIDLTYGLICYIRSKGFNKHLLHAYSTNHKEEGFDTLQDAINVMATRFTLGLYFQDETS